VLRGASILLCAVLPGSWVVTWWTWVLSSEAFASLPLLPGSWHYSFVELPLWLVLPGSSCLASLWWLLCRVAHLPTKAALPGSSPTRQNRSLALATSLFTKHQPNGCDFEGTYTSERFLTSRSVRRGQWVYRKGIRVGWDCERWGLAR